MDVLIVRVSALILAVALLLTACAPPQPRVQQPAPPVVGAREPSDAATDLLARGEPERAAALLEARADTASPDQQPLLLLRAAEIRLDLGQTSASEALLARVNELLLPDPHRYRKALLEIRLLLAGGQILAAENRLSLLDPPTPQLRAPWLRTQAELAEATGRPLDAARALVELDALLPDRRLREQNQRAIWTTLSEVPLEMLRALMPPPPDQTGAWLELAYLTRSHRLEPDTLEAELKQWRRRYPRHPANDGLIQELLAYYRDAVSAPERVALLLPLSGNLSVPGKAVLEGFMAAYYASDYRPQIKIYDVGDDPIRALTAYQEAVSAGSDFVVGPLTKESLIMLASASRLTTPLLALNTLPAGVDPVSGMYQFALAPEDEAVAAADYAVSQGLERALVMVPEGEWGERVAAAFTRALEQRGGTVLETVSYNAQGTDFSAPISALLNLNASNQRARQLRNTLKRSIRTEPQRRQDVEVIFVGAFPRAARLIRPQLRFFDAIDVPVIATSHAYSGAPNQADKDLDGVQIVDMPWLLRAVPGHGLNRQELQQLREMASQHPRLYAFGIDAYLLVRYLPLLRQHPTESLEGHSGVLSLDAQGQIRRRLFPAGFRSGTLRFDGQAAQRAFGFNPDYDEAEAEPAATSSTMGGNAAW